MAKRTLETVQVDLKKVQAELADLKSKENPDEVKVRELSERITELENEAKALSTPKAADKASLPKGVFEAVVEQIRSLSGSKQHQEAVDALEESECYVESRKGNAFIVHAGRFGYRKVSPKN